MAVPGRSQAQCACNGRPPIVGRPQRLAAGTSGAPEGGRVNLVTAPAQRPSRRRRRLPSLETRRTLAALPTMAWCGDADGSVTWTNPAWKAYFGPVWEERTSLVELVPPEEAGRLAAGLASGQGTTGIEAHLRRRDGTYRRHRLTLSPLPDGSGPDWLGIATDIEAISVADDARLWAEERAAGVLLGFLLESAPIGFALFDPDGRYQMVNAPLARKHMRRVEDYAGRLPREVVPEHAERLDAGFAAVWSTGQPIENRQVRTYDANGAERRWLESMYRVEGEAGRPLGVGVIVIDVTELEQARQDREATLERYVGLELAIPQLVWTADAMGRIDYVNPRWVDYTGMSLADAADLGWWAATEPADRDQAGDAWRRGVREGREIELECRLAGRDGRSRWFLVRAVPFHDGGGAVVGYVGTCTDVDDQKAVEGVLRESEIRLQFLAEASRILGESLDYQRTLDQLAKLAVPLLADWCLVEITTPDGGTDLVALAGADVERIGSVREAWTARPQRPGATEMAARVIQTGRSELRPHITDDELVATTRSTEQLAVARSFEPRSALCVPLLGRTGPVGAITLVSARSGRTFAAGDLAIAEELGRRAGAAIDSARLYREQVQAEARAAGLAVDARLRAAELQAAIRAMDEAVVILGPDGRVRLMNGAGQRLLGQPLPTSAADVGAAFIRHDGQALDLTIGDEVGPLEVRLVGGDERSFELRAVPIRYGAHEAEHDGQIVVIRDITDWHQREAASEAFLSVLSHELRTPITTIYGSTRLLANDDDGLLAEERRGVLRDVEEEAARLARLVDDMLVLARIREERVTIADEPILIHRLLPRIVSAERGYQPGVNIQLRVEGEVPPARGDATYLEQVVRNLLSNAAKYGASGSLVEVIAAGEDGGVSVRVLDEGPGYPPAEQAKLFDLYYRSDSTAGTAGGAGVGLFVCRRLMQAMGGRIWTRIRPEGGAEFGFWLPAYEEPEA
ncbi:MAG TPA: PAS domain-containing protein [Candidatus Limnocylindrales bacterium]|nr:PAS domain-containing protein [Candidatus Limnocylindrales bacterium]